MLKSTKLRNKIDIKSSNIDSKSPRSTVSYCFPGFPGVVWGQFSEGSESCSEYSECSSE
jgi:hypothetical protein